MPTERTRRLTERSTHRLGTIADTLSINEMFLAPELSTLAALDASLLATIKLLDFSYPPPHIAPPDRDHFSPNIDAHLADSICILAHALRHNLAAYYAAVADACCPDTLQPEVDF